MNPGGAKCKHKKAVARRSGFGQYPVMGKAKTKTKEPEKLVQVSVRLPESITTELTEMAEEQGRKLQAVYAKVLRAGLEAQS